MVYEIRKAKVEIHLSEQQTHIAQVDIEDSYNAQPVHKYSVIFESDSLQELETIFQKEKENCNTVCAFQESVFVTADLLFLIENNEKEEILDSFAKPALFKKQSC